MTPYPGSIIATLCLACLGATAPPEERPAKDEKKPDDLAAKLIRNTVEQSTEEDPMAEMMREMTEIAEKLQVDFDPGEQTQVQQRQVSARLDEAIKAAAARTRPKSQSDPKQSSDKRTMPTAKKTEPRPPDKKQAGSEGQAKSAAEKSANEAAAAKQDSKSDLPNMRRTWGNLPQRDRDEVMQGAEEESLERFRPWIDQYFRALQESNP